MVTPATAHSTAPSLSQLAAGAKADRNRAVDAYRAAAMGAVALGHWMAIAIGTDGEGRLIVGNALSSRPSLGWMTWLLQVMPLFFVVGGFSSAMSLDSHLARRGRSEDWVVARLRRMVGPAMVLATTWLSLLAGAVLLSATTGAELTGFVAAGAVGAAIPLWFLANYTIDTAIAPYLLPLFRRSPRLVIGLGVGTFLALEATRLADLGGALHYLHYGNWVLGWLLFQVLGFAWRDGLLPAGRRLVPAAAGLWGVTLAAVAIGPWPTAMVHFPGLTNSPTHPPSLALMLFGTAYSLTALAFAPALSSFLARSGRAWAGVVAANSVALSVYLWHLSAAAVAGAVFHALGWLPTADIGSSLWWLQKLPLMTASAAILAAIVATVAGVERRALLAPRTPWRGTPVSMFMTAVALSAAIKLWANPNIALVTVGMTVVAVLWLTTIRDVRSSAEVGP